jgi:hypothetical protein
MPFVPFTKKSAMGDDATASPTAPAFSKKPGKRKQRKAAPAQKALMNPGGRAMSGGGR